jgi:hypothetical protein
LLRWGFAIWRRVLLRFRSVSWHCLIFQSFSTSTHDWRQTLVSVLLWFFVFSVAFTDSISAAPSKKRKKERGVSACTFQSRLICDNMKDNHMVSNLIMPAFQLIIDTF